MLWLSLGYVDSLSSDRTRLSYIFQTSYIISQQIRLSGDLMHHINYLLKRIFINSKSQSYGSDLLANAYISELLVHLAQSSLFSTNGIINYEPAKALNKDSSLVLKVLKYIEDHIYEPIHIDSLCGCFFVSRSHLSKIFSEELGLPVYRYIMKKKLLLARIYRPCRRNTVLEITLRFIKRFVKNLGRIRRILRKGRGWMDFKYRIAKGKPRKNPRCASPKIPGLENHILFNKETTSRTLQSSPVSSIRKISSCRSGARIGAVLSRNFSSIQDKSTRSVCSPAAA